MPGSRTLYAHTQPGSYSGKKKDSQWWKPQSDLHSVLRTQDPTPPSSDPTGPASPSGPLRTPRPPPPCQWLSPQHTDTHTSADVCLPRCYVQSIHSLSKSLLGLGTVWQGRTLLSQARGPGAARPPTKPIPRPAAACPQEAKLPKASLLGRLEPKGWP